MKRFVKAASAILLLRAEARPTAAWLTLVAVQNRITRSCAASGVVVFATATLAASSWRTPPSRARNPSSHASPDGCTEAVMLAHGFTVAQMVELVRAQGLPS
jgi:hypothetical protein